MRRIAIVGDYDPSSPSHSATNSALRHAADRLGLQVEAQWIATDRVNQDAFDHFSAMLIAPGSPYKDMENTLAAIRFAREQSVPCLGTCGGFQHMVIEYARNVLGVQGAQHAEYEPSSAEAFITPLECSLVGRSMRLKLASDSQIASIYGSDAVEEQYFCGLGVDPSRVAQLKSGPLRVVGSDPEGEVRAIELPGHPFFIGTLYVPQARSLPGRPHPLISALLRATPER
jgi:CTP synthase (UTP-ammonia lyase)